MMDFFSKLLSGTKRSRRQVLEDQIFCPANPKRRTLGPEPTPENAGKELRELFKKTECLQPYLNFSLGAHWRFDETPGHLVSLGTYDQPDYGRTFEIRYNAALVGILSVVQDWMTAKEGSVELRLRLQFPIELLPSEQVHVLLTEIAFSVFDNRENANRYRAEQLATNAMTKAIWDSRRSTGLSTVVELSVAGSLGVYQSAVDHWHRKGVKPWEELEQLRDQD